MNWDVALERNRAALMRLVMGMFAMAGAVPGGTVSVLPRPLKAAMLRLLRPAESALRRLILARTRGVSLAARKPRAAPTEAIPRGAGAHVPSFRLIDPRKRFDLGGKPPVRYGAPRLSFPGLDDPVFEPARAAEADDAAQVERILRRLRAMHHALRPGRPPGYLARGRDEIDEILSDCDILARMALKPPDTS